MNPDTRTLSRSIVIAAASLIFAGGLRAQNGSGGFHGAPVSAKSMTNPYGAQPPAGAKRLFHLKCARCHGDDGEGSGNIPSLAKGPAQKASDGEIFWYVTKGDDKNGMPSWSSLPKQQRWEIISYVRKLEGAKSSPATKTASSAAAKTDHADAQKTSSAKAAATVSAADAKLPPPKPPFTDFRYEKPGLTRKITVADLPEPFATPSAGNGPKTVPRPEKAWPQVPQGFVVEMYASGLSEPRLIRTAPNGDFFVAETEAGDVKIFRGITGQGKPELLATFADGLHKPFGINFYPPGSNPQWIYIANTDSVVRFPYQNGDVKARGSAEHLADLPDGQGHSTRDVQFTQDGKKMLVSVGSASNVDDPDTTPEEKNRADILEFNPDGSDMRVFAYGIRNAVGLAVNPKTGELWCSVNERDALGDNLVPDYITHVQDGGFYGWPWWYMGPTQDPRHKGKHPELKDKYITPDVLLNPHNASLQITFYDGKMFPAEYQGDIFAAEHGSWNRGVRVGYELIRVPLHQTGHASGEYQDFMTGFVVDNGHVWGRPVGVTVAPDGSLLVTDDASNSIWHIRYTAK